MSSARQKLGSAIALLHKVADSAEMAKAKRELGAAGPKKWLVVRVGEGETEQQAYTRAVAMNPWVAALSPAALDRLLVIVVRRVEQPVTDTLSA